VRNKRRSITECNLDPLEGTLRYCRSGFRTDLDLLIRHVYIYINAFPDIGFSNRATVFCLRLERILIVRINILYEDAMHTVRNAASNHSSFASPLGSLYRSDIVRRHKKYRAARI